MTTVLPLPLSYVGETGRQILFPTLLLDGAQAVLVDCGYPGSLPLLEAALRPLGLRAADLTGVFLTHHDDDHVGGLAQLKRAVPHLPVMTGAEEAPYLSGARKSLRLAQADAPALRRLFYDTVHAVCAADYTPAQLDAWATADYDAAAWESSLLSRTTLAAEEDGRLLGFGNIGPDGYLDLLYVRKDCQHQGIATVLCDFLETLYPVDRATVHASITARPFFEARGYRVLRAQQVERRGQLLTNYVMEKEMV